jgi:NADPH:quinone reductase-like Zn-dependent oxidoreductase
LRQVFITRTGGPEVLELRETPDPLPTSGAVRIRVKAAGVNFADIMARKGLYPDAPRLPAVVGYEVSGVVDAVGPGTSEDWLDKEVVALIRT